MPFWHQGLPLKLFIAHHVAYISLRRLDALVLKYSSHQSNMALLPPWFYFFPRDISEDLGAIKLTEGFLLYLSARDRFGLQLGKPISFGVLFYSRGMSCWWNTLTLWTIVLWKWWPSNMTRWLMLALGGQLPPPPHTPSPACPLLETAASRSYPHTSHSLTFCTLNDLIGIEQTDQNVEITSNLLTDHFWRAERRHAVIRSACGMRPRAQTVHSHIQFADTWMKAAFFSGLSVGQVFSIMSQPKLLSVCVC